MKLKQKKQFGFISLCGQFITTRYQSRSHTISDISPLRGVCVSLWKRMASCKVFFVVGCVASAVDIILIIITWFIESCS